MLGTRRFSAALFGLALAPLLMAAAPAAGAKGKKADAGARLEKVERSLEERRKEDRKLRRKAKKVKSDIDQLRQESITAAKAIQKYEADITWLEKRISELDQEEKEKNVTLSLSQGQFVNVLAALQRMARRPPEALFVQPLSPSDTVRSAILLRAAAPMIERRAKKLRLELAELARTRNESFKRRTELSASIGEITKQRARMNGLLNRKSKLSQQTESERRKVAKWTLALAGQADSLCDLLSRLKKENQKRARKRTRKRVQMRTQMRAMKKPPRSPGKALKFPPAVQKPPPTIKPSIPPGVPLGASIRKAKGALPYPVVGSLSGYYGQATKTGLTRKGITIETRAGAQVVAPFEGRVVFAGEFRGYGQLLIIEHSEGYHTLLAGLERIDGETGQRVLGGEPVGIMGDADGGAPTLYVELRRNGRPINPLPWLSARKSKVSG
ncbi:MAG TPA: peptidase M23 [Rhodospirillales bacterium]|nr:peptidase M23 [Rhodospirillales bacterium]